MHVIYLVVWMAGANAFNTFDAAKNSQFISGLLSAQESTGSRFSGLTNSGVPR